MEDLHRLADELREAFSARGHGIQKALQADPAFQRTRRSQSSLVRDLVLDGVRSATARIGLGYIPVVGGGCDVQAMVEGVDRRYRVLKANVDPDTRAYQVLASNGVEKTDTDSIFLTEQWVLGYTVDDGGFIVDIFEAKVDGLSGHAVPFYVLTRINELGTHVTLWPDSVGFRPADEDGLDGMDEGNDGLAAGA